MRLLRHSALAAAVAAAAISLASQVSAQPYGPGMMGGFGYGYGSGLGMFGPILMVLSVAVIIVASIWFLRRFAPAGSHRMHGPRSGGLDVLEERYARGEINRDEYLQKKKDIVG